MDSRKKNDYPKNDGGKKYFFIATSLQDTQERLFLICEFLYFFVGGWYYSGSDRSPLVSEFWYSIFEAIWAIYEKGEKVIKRGIRKFTTWKGNTDIYQISLYYWNSLNTTPKRWLIGVNAHWGQQFKVVIRISFTLQCVNSQAIPV